MMRNLYCAWLILVSVLVLVGATSKSLAYKEEIASGKKVLAVDVCDETGSVVYASLAEDKLNLNIVGGAESVVKSKCGSAIKALHVRCFNDVVWVASLSSS